MVRVDRAVQHVEIVCLAKEIGRRQSRLRLGWLIVMKYEDGHSVQLLRIDVSPTSLVECSEMRRRGSHWRQRENEIEMVQVDATTISAFRMNMNISHGTCGVTGTSRVNHGGSGGRNELRLPITVERTLQVLARDALKTCYVGSFLVGFTAIVSGR